MVETTSKQTEILIKKLGGLKSSGAEFLAGKRDRERPLKFHFVLIEHFFFFCRLITNRTESF
jgi:hypothetical protein